MLCQFSTCKKHGIGKMSGRLEGVDPYLIDGVKEYDGANHHPSDKNA